MTQEELVTTTKKRKRKQQKTISFDEEIVTKDTADKIFKDIKLIDKAEASTANKEIPKNKKVGQKKQKIMEQVAKKAKIPKRNANKPELNESIESIDELDPKKPEIRTGESIRAKKRNRFAKLMSDQKNKSELGMQQKCLSYLSLWKHGKNEWKFEKLKQIWLQQNMFDDVKIPEKFWESLVEYFNQSKGKVRNEILKAALKIIESVDKTDEDNKINAEDDENKEETKNGDENKEEADDEKKSATGNRFERARIIVQHLQE